MTLYSELSEYSFRAEFGRPGTLNVGWLESGCEYERARPTAELRGLLWAFSTISIAETRGLHECSLCTPARVIEHSRDGRRLLLGSAEIRVFSGDGEIYAAPNLVFHYVDAHDYRPPAPFLRALVQGPRPPGRPYFDALDAMGLTWSDTPTVE